MEQPAVVYEKNATCPHWEKFLSEVFQNDQEIIRFFRTFMGRILYGENPQHAMGVLYGEKTGYEQDVLLGTIKHLFGDYGKILDGRFWNKKWPSTIQGYKMMAEVQHARLVTIPDIDQNGSFRATNINRLTGMQQIYAMDKNRNRFIYFSNFTVVVCSAKLLPLDLENERLLGSVIPFQIYESPSLRKNQKFEDYIDSELSGILNWLLAGWTDYCEETQFVNPWKIPDKIREKCYLPTK